MKLTPKGITLIAGVAIILFLTVAYNVQRKTIRLQNEKIARLTDNIQQLIDDSVNQEVLYLTEKELSKAMKFERDSIAAVLNIRPKTITKYVEKVIYQRDTIVKFIPVVQKSDTTWSFTDNGECYVYKGTVFYTGDSVKVQKNDFIYTNEIIDTYFWKRKFPIFGKKKYFQESFSKCGGVSNKEINIVRK